MAQKAEKTVSKELVSLIKLVSFFKQLRHKDDLEKTGFFFVNDLFNILPYRQCIFWTYENNKVTLRSGSGQIDIGNQNPLSQFLKKAVKTLIKKKNAAEPTKQTDNEEQSSDSFSKIVKVSPTDLNTMSPDIVSEWLSANCLCVFLYDQKKLIGGVWMERGKPLGTMEEALLDDACDALSGRIQFYAKNNRKRLKNVLANKKYRVAALIGLLIICLWPVRFSVTASAEIVPQDISVITIPFNSQIKDVLIRPNQDVKEGDTLFTLDKVQLENEYALAAQKLNSARAALSKTERETFTDPSKRSQLNAMREEIKSKQLDMEYAKKRLAYSDVKASSDGIALFSDVNDLTGKPVRAGDKIMTLAAPDDIELMIRIPSNNMIDMNTSVPVKFFLNVDPLKSRKATIHTVSYQPTQDASGILSYKARANIAQDDAKKRIGLTGTAKIYGNRTIFIFNVLRRPFITLRNAISF